MVGFGIPATYAAGFARGIPAAITQQSPSKLLIENVAREQDRNHRYEWIGATHSFGSQVTITNDAPFSVALPEVANAIRQRRSEYHDSVANN